VMKERPETMMPVVISCLRGLLVLREELANLPVSYQPHLGSITSAASLHDLLSPLTLERKIQRM